jgi:hypothetical protein
VNNYTSQDVTYGTVFAQSVLAAFSTAPANPLIHTGKLRLSQDPAFNPQPNSTVAGLAANEATYTGYTAGGVAVALSGGLLPSPNLAGALQTELFTAAGGGTFVPNNVTGWWIDDGTNVIAGERFAGGAVCNFAEVGDYLVLTVILPEYFLQLCA